MPPEPLYAAGDFVLIEKLFFIESSLHVKKLDVPIVVRVTENRGHTSLGYAYVLSIPEKHKLPNAAGVCYWESDILCKTEDPDEYLWKIWGDQ